MKRFAWVLGLLLVLAGCTAEEEPDLTTPPMTPTRQIQGSILPYQVADYTALGSTPGPLQMSVTYASDHAPLDLAVVTFDPTGEFQGTPLSESKWYGLSRCGIMWTSGAQTTPQPMQVACITVCTDGVMTTVSGGQQSVEDIAELANAIYEVLVSA